MEMKVYGAYGSNINLEQMACRCPNADVYKVGYINGYRLTFRSGGFANIEKSEGDRVPVLLWTITEQCERALDHYEGYPSFYIKQDIPVEIDDGNDEIEAMFYVMTAEHCRKMRPPTQYYYRGIERGYESNGMPTVELKAAFERCMAEMNDKTYSCNGCGQRLDFDRDVIWVTSSYGLCEKCYDKLSEAELEKIREEYE